MSRRPTLEARDDRNSANLTLAIAATHAAVAMYLGAKLNVWIDECYTLDTVSGSIGYAWSQAIAFEAQPPGYFLLLNLWLRLVDTVFFARILSIVFTTLTILICHLISRLYLGSSVHLSLLPLLVAIQPLTLWAAVEMRRYALVLLLASLVILVFKKAFPDEPTRRGVGWKVVYLAVAVASLYVDYFTVFLIAAHGVVLATNRRWHDLASLMLIGVVVAILSVPLVLGIMDQVSAYVAVEDPSTGQATKAMKFVSFAVDNLVMTQWLHPWNRAVKVLLFAAAIYIFVVTTAISHARSAASPMFEPMVLTITVGAGFVLVSFLATPSMLHPKHLGVMMIPWAMMAAATWAICRRAFSVVFLSSIVAMNLVSNVRGFWPLAKRGDFIRVARFIQEREKDNEPILAFHPEVALGFEHHYDGVNEVIPVPKSIDFGTYDLTGFVVPASPEFSANLSSRIGRANNVWVLTEPSSDIEIGRCGIGHIDFNCELFERMLTGDYSLVEDSRFFQTRVRYFVRRPHRTRATP